MTDTMLSVRDLCGFYNDFQALFGVSLEVKRGETVAIVGANGAGKSTLLRIIMGQVASTGTVTYNGADLGGVDPHVRVKSGLCLVPEGRKLFPSLSVRENLQIGSHAGRPGPWTVDTVVGVLPLIERLLDRPAGKLSGGEQQAVAIGRALMSNPEVLLLDEVSLGLAPIVVNQIYETLQSVVETGMTTVVVEQDLSQALAVSDRLYCLLEGKVSLQGKPDELDKAEITAAYFGVA